MKNITCVYTMALLAGWLTLCGQSAAADSSPISGRQAFELMKRLAGEWSGKMDEEGSQPPVTVTYRVTAAQSAVLETLFPGTEHEMVTLYHMDGEKLVLTHYCAAGNQPHMVLTKKSTPTDLRFDFVSGSNVNPKKDMHMHSAHIHLAGSDTISGEWTGFQDGKPGHVARFSLSRKKDAALPR